MYYACGTRTSMPVYLSQQQTVSNVQTLFQCAVVQLMHDTLRKAASLDQEQDSPKDVRVPYNPSGTSVTRKPGCPGRRKRHQEETVIRQTWRIRRSQ